MQKKWKSVSGLLSVVLASMLMLSACSEGEKKQQAGDGEQADTSKPYEIVMTLLVPSTPPDLQLVADEINKITKAKINATIKFIPFSYSAYNQQMSLMLAGNEKVDLMLSGTFFNFGSQVAKGQLEPLNELLTKDGKGIVDAVGQDLINAAKVDGKIYGIPTMRDFAADNGLVMRKDLVEKYNIDLSKIKTWEDLGPIFKVIKDNEPGMTPLVQAGNTAMPASFMYGAGVDTFGDNLGVIVDPSNSTQIVNLFETKEFAESVALVHKWYKAGYINTDIATSQELGSSLVKSGKAFSYILNLKPGHDIQESQLTGKEMVEVSLTKPLQTSNNITNILWAISKNSKNPEKAMQFMNLMYTDKDIANLLSLGIEGKHYVKKTDNLIALPEGVEQSSYPSNQIFMGNNFLTYVWEGNAPDYWEQMKTFNDSAIKSKAVGFNFDVMPVKTEMAAVTNVINQYKNGLESGTLDPALIDEFNTKLKSAGLDKIIAEKQNQFDAWLNSGKK
jgi:ABC-type sugar transport system, periplasmic component